jgi:aromatic ring-opening dioxygenase catalytic subunit (LigB family)
MKPFISIPVVAASRPPGNAADARKFAQRIRRHAEIFQARGVVAVSTHWNRPGESVKVALEVEEARQSDAAVRKLVEQLSTLLEAAGLTPEVSRGCGDTMAWRPIVEALADNDIPIVHVSVPVRFGDDLMRLTAVALQGLRHEGILFVGFSDVFGDALLVEEESAEQRPYVAEGVPV